MKKFYSSKSNIKLAGICEGLVEHFDTDTLLWRLLLVILFFTPIPIFLIYIITTLLTSAKTEN